MWINLYKQHPKIDHIVVPNLLLIQMMLQWLALYKCHFMRAITPFRWVLRQEMVFPLANVTDISKYLSVFSVLRILPICTPTSNIKVPLSSEPYKVNVLLNIYFFLSVGYICHSQSYQAQCFFFIKEIVMLSCTMLLWNPLCTSLST